MKISLKNLCYIVTLVTQLSIGQTNVDLRPQVKSPEVNKFEQYMNMPVNLVSGTPQISIPIYTLEYGGMTLPITLEYDASGVKVESIASSVGQNWSLNVGGAVSRIVKGAPDEGLQNASSNTAVWANILNTYGFYKDYGLSQFETKLNLIPETSNTENYDPYDKCGMFNFFMNDVDSGYLDTQPDLFTFSTPQGSGKFVFNDQRQVVYTENTDFFIKEEYINTGDYFRTFNAFAPNGVKYKFGLSTGSIDNIKRYTNNYVEQTGTKQVGEGVINKLITNTWFLSEITNTKNDKKITIEYIENNYEQIINHIPSILGHIATICNLSADVNCQLNEKSVYTTYAKQPNYNPYGSSTMFYLTNNNFFQNRTESRLISKVIAGLTTINFVYENRDDLMPDYYNLNNKGKKLKEININYGSICIKKIIFNYENKTTTIPIAPNTFSSIGDDNKKRFFLNEIVETNCDNSSEKRHNFVYNTTSLPNRLSYAQDKWGYYNGKDSNVTLFPKYSYLDDDEYFADRYTDINFMKSGILEKIIYPSKGSVNFEFEGNYSDEIIDYRLGTSPQIVANISPQTFQMVNNQTYNSNNFIYDDNLSNSIYEIETELMFPSFEFSSPPSYCYPNYGGKAVEIVNSNGQVIVQIPYSLLVSTPSSSKITKLVKIRLNPLNYNLVNGQLYTLKVYGIPGCYFNTTKIKKYSKIAVHEVGGLRIKKIIHKNYDDSVVKSTSYTYANSKLIHNPKIIYNMSYDYNTMYYELSGILSNYNIEYLTSRTIYRQTPPTPEWPNESLLSASYKFISTGADPISIYYGGPNVTYSNVNEITDNGIVEHNFHHYKNYFELNSFSTPSYPAVPKFQSILAGSKISEITKDSIGNIVKTSNVEYNYTVSNVNVKGILATKLAHLQAILLKAYTIQGQTKTLKTETETVKLNGQDVTTTKQYEYNGNAHNQPTKITTSDSMGNSNITTLYYPSDLLAEPFMVDLVAQNRKDTPIRSENYKNTSKIFEQKTTYAKDASTNNFLLPKNVYAAKFPNVLPLIANVGNLEKKVTSDLYDSQGNLTQFTQESGVPVSIIWGYNQTQPVAKLENIAYGSIPASLIANIQTVSNLPTSTEADVMGVLNALRTSTDANLQKALITTYTYKPLIGVSTITDPKGDKMTYVYDTFGRLEYVKDKSDKILSNYQYHYKN